MSDYGTILNTEKPTDLLNTNRPAQQEANDLWEIIKVEHQNFLKYSIVIDILKELINDGDLLDFNLKHKVKDVVLGSQCCQATVIDGKNKDSSVSRIFGIDDTRTELTYLERNHLRSALTSRLNDRLVTLELNVKDNPVTDDSPIFQLADKDQALIDLRLKLKHEQKTYVDNLLKKEDILMQLKTLRLNTLPNVIDSKFKESVAQCKMNHLKAEILYKKIQVDSMTETKVSLKAFKEFIAGLKQQQLDCQQEIEGLEECKKKYKTVACKHYDDILRSYLQYKASNEKKKLLYECLTN